MVVAVSSLFFFSLVSHHCPSVTRLTKVLRSIGMCQTPYVVAGTEHLGSSTITHAAPKRAETFAGFDSLDLRKGKLWLVVL